jgi:8-oxo-dGTP pyrophosphatase MutT (NUDIX family)
MVDASYYQKPEGIREDESAGGIVVRIMDRQVQVALVREGTHDLYILPKGGIETGESPETAARREIEEEAGLTGLHYLAPLGVQERLNYRKTYWKKIYYFLYLLQAEPGKPTDPYHKYICDWFPLEKLPAMFWPEQRELIEKNIPFIQEVTRIIISSLST